MSREAEPLSGNDKLALTVIYQKGLNLAPILDVDFGYRYPDVEVIFKIPREETVGKLNSLWKLGYLKRELCATVMKCPKCGSYKLILRLQCPYCGSFKLLKGNSIKHYSCGHIDFEDRFRRDDELICPNCGKKLEKLGLDYMRVGIWYRCLDCGRSFGEPRELLYCPECDKNYEREELILEPVYSYAIEEVKVKELLLDIDLRKLEEALSDKWITEIPAKVVGESGIEHTFSLALTSKGVVGRRVFIDIEYATEYVDLYVVMRFFAKLTDVKSGSGLLVGIPRFTEEAKKLAGTYGVKIFEGARFLDIIGEVINYLDSVFKEKV